MKTVKNPNKHTPGPMNDTQQLNEVQTQNTNNLEELNKFLQKKIKDQPQIQNQQDAHTYQQQIQNQQDAHTHQQPMMDELIPTYNSPLSDDANEKFGIIIKNLGGDPRGINPERLFKRLENCVPKVVDAFPVDKGYVLVLNNLY